jgi:hypothetical protein
VSKTPEQITAYLDRKRLALDDPNYHSRFWTELADGNDINFEVNADHDAEVQIQVQALSVTVFVNMMLAEARAVHDALGRAIAERAEEVEYIGAGASDNTEEHA